MTKNLIKITFLNLALLLVFSACTQRAAPISSKGKLVYNRGNSHKNFVESGQSNLTITAGDTVYSISRRTGVPIRDLIEANNLQPPYILVIGQRISIPSARYHQVASGDTLYGISRQYGMNVNNLVELNNLSRPYTIRIGDKLRISGSEPKRNNSQNTKIVKSGDLDNKPKISLFGHKNKFIWPVKGTVISNFGQKEGGLYNDGINIRASKGTSVKAVEDGSVAYVGNELRGYGNLIIIKHSGGWISAYAHLDKTSVKRGDKVKQGTDIATIGSTGNVKAPQLYFGIRKGREAVNPQTYLN